MQSKQDDMALFERISEGDMKAYRALFSRYFPDLCNFLLLYLHSKEICEEVALDIFAYIWEKKESIEIRTSVKNFLFGAAKNKAIDYFRKEQQRLFSSLSSTEFLIPEGKSSELILENKELQEIIQKAIDDLPEKSRLIYQMAWEEDLSYKEIASRLNLSVKTVENHIGIALKKLRESLHPYYKQIFMLLLIFLQQE
ncbi:MAG: RNA polymerase sigma-70 factor [Mangrovibacterium sp.]